MARIRTVKPEFFTHPEVVACTVPARYLLLALLTQADDEGRLYDQPRRIAANAFGEGDRINAERLLGELATRGRIVRYEALGRRCIAVVNFRKHQRIDRPSSSSIPGPFDEPRGGGSAKARRGLVDDSTGELGKGTREGNKGTGNEVSLAPPARRDELFEALADACGIDWHHLTPTARNALGTATAALRQAGDATPDEVARRVHAYRLTFPEAACTPSAVAKHWPALANGPQVGRALSTADRLLIRSMEDADGTPSSTGARGTTRGRLPAP